MAFSRRIVFFLAVNMAVLVLLGTVLRLFGLDTRLYTSTGINLPTLLIFAMAFGFGGSFISLALSKRIAKWSTKAKVLPPNPSNPTEAWLVSTVQRLAQQSNLQPPEVAVFPSASPNAFATGARRNKALVAVSEGLLTGMDEAEVEAVLAHEISHIANGDMITMALLQGVLNTFVIFLSRVVGFFVDSALSRGSNRRGFGIGYWLTVIACEILFGIVASIIAMWFSRRREFRADAGAARLVGAQPMIHALQRLQQASPAVLPKSLAAFGIRGGPTSLLSSHPSLDERIVALSHLSGRSV